MNLLLTNSISWSTVGLVVGIIAILAIIFGLLIVLVHKFTYVKEDERISKTTEKLSGANCGGCGFAGCADFAKALVEGRTTLDSCNATDNDSKKEIALYLNIDYNDSVDKMAVVCCNGGINAKDKYNYVGEKDCYKCNALFGGFKSCQEGCLGFGTCKNACEYNAIQIKNGVAVVDKNLCVGCGACINKCPNVLIEYVPKTAKVYVACSTKCVGKSAVENCKVSCIGCGLCAKNCPSNAIEMKNGLPVIDYEKCTGCEVCVNKCPRKCIKTL